MKTLRPEKPYRTKHRESPLRSDARSGPTPLRYGDAKTGVNGDYMKNDPKNKQKFSAGIWSRLIDYVNSFDIYALMLVPTFIGIIFIAIGLLLYNFISQDKASFVWNRIIFSVGCFIIGFGGIFQIIKKELLDLLRRQNLMAFLAIVNGIFFVVICWSLAVALNFDEYFGSVIRKKKNTHLCIMSLPKIALVFVKLSLSEK